VRLVSFRHDGVRTGLVVGDEIVDLTDPAIELPGDMPTLLALGDGSRDALARAPSTAARRFAVAETRLAAPVPRPPSFLAIARNYQAHVAELGHERPEFQTWFSKQSTCVVGPGEPIQVPRVSATVDYEGSWAWSSGPGAATCRRIGRSRSWPVSPW
jgi:2-keto-4-pentenoate hydratase/2-oxohepta-3-ene-1,7-dioic acid hydratase in catechol pathway